MTGRRELERAAGAVQKLGLRGAGEARVDVTLIGERRMARLNREYKGRRGAAEILTFVYDGYPSGDDEGASGEILLCWKRLASSADRLRVSRRSYLLRLVAHGISHMEGFTHGSDDDAARMEGRESELLDGLVPERDLERMFSCSR